MRSVLAPTTGWFRFGRKQLNGKWVFDLDKITGELAESYDVSPDGLKLTFHLRKDAKFQDGTPVTAEDVKWSLDRVVTAPVLGKAQLLTGSMTSADQFKVIDPLTFEVTLPKPDKLALPNLATVYPIIINSKLAKEHATAEDPWATAWLKEHTAGSGAYVIETLQAGRTGDHDAQRGLESRLAPTSRRPSSGSSSSRCRSRRHAPTWSSAATPISPSICRRATCSRSRPRASSR